MAYFNGYVVFFPVIKKGGNLFPKGILVLVSLVLLSLAVYRVRE